MPICGRSIPMAQRTSNCCRVLFWKKQQGLLFSCVGSLKHHLFVEFLLLFVLFTMGRQCTLKKDALKTLFSFLSPCLETLKLAGCIMQGDLAVAVVGGIAVVVVVVVVRVLDVAS
ncbi:unnamed protein product [Polarella glacialis]|uniref:Uncharacterized protein n=1 Tax=Polarella glacialis TaxID=89957 RepID=A0A813J7R5_POLGL|nr:unnamed protein product [Polarella glacialis]